ncbi:DUF3413 domain-containing protein [Alteromonas aestuariivivens]|uniref:DUF3413 domain-containing protein n=1 Tax=Alteromonas aestuariivivens TaxID=1938339 RepID=A0A3D8M812_9ALTE|nr:DUF3413 domain-containing protein [Alteromonas aestuariivivens]RDV26025.1 DUF3413 domain-containing protein [Alteromonas aestuariivivens]
MILAESPRRQRVTKLVNWGHWFALVNIAIAIIIASIFIFSSPSPGTVSGSLYLVANWLGHIGFLTFFGFVIFILPLCYLVSNPRVIKVSASAIAATGLALLAFDALLYNRTGFHISVSSANLLRSEAQTQISQFGLQQWGFLSMLFVVWFGFQLILANALWKRIDRLMSHKIGIPVTSFFVVCFVASHAVHVWADANLYQPIIKQDNMFPLSYPATAKTTMSRYGLLDLDRYEERKRLQFDPDIHQFTYPTAPVYCSINSQQNALLIVQTDSAPLPEPGNLNLRVVENYFSTASTLDGLLLTTLFGVPEIYQESLAKETPIMLALPIGLGMPTSLHVDESLPTNMFEAYQKPLSNHHPGLHIAFLPADKIQGYLSNEALVSGPVLIASGFGPDSRNPRGRLFTNLNINAPLSSTEDLAPTMLNALGCTAPVNYYSTGQNLLQPTRNWLVSTSGERVVVIHNSLRTEVLSNGSYEISDIQTGNRSNEALNVDLLSQAIKHLTRFSHPE